jgi:DNA-binding response OmpR family regulator
MNKRILIIEDDQPIADLMQLHLRDVTEQVEHITTGDEGLVRAQSEHWDLVILDVRLPGMDGLDVCRKLRESTQYIPILMVTAKSTELDRVLGLEIGADDYITKPFSVVEFVARVKTIFRRVAAIERQQTKVEDIRIKDIQILVNEREAFVADKCLDLTPKEFDLLLHFAQNPGRVFRRLELLDSVWGYGHEGYEHTVNSHINRLRAKLEKDPVSPDYITTVWGVGYKLTIPEMSASL